MKEKIKTGKLLYLENEDYHKLPAISASNIKMMKISKKLYDVKDMLMRKESPSMDIGTALHEYLLERDKFKLSKYNLTQSQIEALNCMLNNGRVMFDDVLEDSEREVSFMAFDEVINMYRKIRCDAYNEKLGIVFDVKTTKATTPRQFKNDAYNLGYHIQAAFYIDTLKMLGYNAKYFTFLVVPNQSPFIPYALNCSQDFLEHGRAQYSEIIYDYLEYKKSGSPIDFGILDLPDYIKNNLYKGEN